MPSTNRASDLAAGTRCRHLSLPGFSAVRVAAVTLGLLLTLAPASTPVLAHGTEVHDADADVTAQPAVVLAPGYTELAFDAPQAGSYELPPIKRAADGDVLDASGDRHRLRELIAGRITVLSFIYQACDDVNGCPLATLVMSQVRARLEKIPGAAERVQLLSMSFDPVNDTPDSIRSYQASFGDSAVSWRFLTSESPATLRPLLSAWDQPIRTVEDEAGSTRINHLLRVYLVDESGWIRNIYSASLLHARTLVSDIETLMLESETADDQEPSPVSELAAHSAADRNREPLQPGNNPVDLLAHARSDILGLPPLAAARLASMSADSIALGRRLFFDRRLSLNDTISCAMCHVPAQGFAVNELATAVGIEGRTVKRNAPTILNVGLLSRLFHDARERRLEQQIWIPLLMHNEMANPSVSEVLDTIASLPEYPPLFLAAFGKAEPTMSSLGQALADYQSSLLAGNSPFDRWFYANDDTAIGSEAQHGFELFRGKAGCSACHQFGEQSALFTDEGLHNTGVGYRRSMKPRHTEPHLVRLAPGVTAMVDPASYADAAETPPSDLGRYDVTEDPADRWFYRTPGLRNVALTAPYMHDGSLNTLEDVVAFYNRGGEANPLLSTAIRPLGLDDTEQRALVRFLESLTSSDIDRLVSDALSVPVGDTNHGAGH